MPVPYVQGQGTFGSDPFGYSGGSLLTPWTQQFVAPEVTFGGGGYQAPNLDPFTFGDFGYAYQAPGGYDAAMFSAPGQFAYGDFQTPDRFAAPTEADLYADPSYQFRRDQGADALEASAAARGMLRTGAMGKALIDYGQQAASQEYGDVYARRAAEYDRAYQNALQGYATNRGNAAENYDRNFNTQFQVHQGNEDNRLAAYQSASDVNLRGGELGYNIASGTWDRNRMNQKDMYESRAQLERERAAAAAGNASAANANSQQAYNRALNEYQMNLGIYQSNQDRQYNMLSGMAGMGMNAAGQQGAYGSQYAGNVGAAYGNYGNNVGNLYAQQGNANAAGQIGSGNAWSGALNNVGNVAGAAAMYYTPQSTYGYGYGPQPAYGGIGRPVYGPP